MKSLIETYLRRFSKLRTDHGNQWPKYPNTKYQAPHKPLLLLSVLDKFEEGMISSNLIVLDNELGALFRNYWNIAMPEDRRGNIAMPFFHLTSEGFWHLEVRAGKQIAGKIHAVSKLLEVCDGARLDDDLFDLLCEPQARLLIREVLLNEYFSEEIGAALRTQASVNKEAHAYSLDLLSKTASSLNEEVLQFDNQTIKAVRDQGFRRAIRVAYDFKCAMTNLRIVTNDGHVVVVGAHIIPWKINQDDSPNNGIALSPTCHWAFDEGLLTITSNYRISVSPQLNARDNSPRYLADLNDTKIYLPVDEQLWPSKKALKWHNKYVYRAH